MGKNMKHTPMYRLLKFQLGKEIDQTIGINVKYKDVLPTLRSLISAYLIQEKQVVMQAYKAGFLAAGGEKKCDDVDILAKLYFQYCFQDQETELNQKEWYVKAKCDTA